jgi:hypothetical protein
MADAQSLALPSEDARPRWKKPPVPQPSLWWLWLLGCLLHVESAVTELVAGKVLASGKDTVLAALWWLGVHAERAGDRGRARALIFVILAFDVSQRLL